MKNSTWKHMYNSLLIISLLLFSFPEQTVFANQPNHVRIPKSEMMLMAGEDSITVVQTIQYQNLDEENIPWFINLPSQYQNFYVFNGLTNEANIDLQDDGVLIQENLPFGETTITIGYTLPLEDRAVTSVIQQPFLMEQIDVIVQVQRLTVSAINFLPQSAIEQYGEMDFRRFTRLNIQPNEQWPIIIRMYRGNVTGTEAVLIAGEAPDPSIPVVGHVHEKDIPKSVINILKIVIILSVGMISIRRSTQGTLLR